MRRTILRAALIAPLALSLSCADMPTAPRAFITVKGSILDKEGVGLGDVAIYFETPLPADREGVEYDYRDYPYYHTITAADGSYEVRMPTGTYDLVMRPLLSSGYASSLVSGLHLTGAAFRFDYRYSWPRVKIVTQRTDGSPILSSEVTFFANSPGSLYLFELHAKVIADTLVAVLQPGNYFIDLDPGGHVSGYPNISDQFTMPNSDTTLTYSLSGYTVLARVLGQGGVPLADASVSTSGAASATTLTGSDGIATFHLPSGWYAWTVHPALTWIAPRSLPYTSITGDANVDLDVSGTDWSGTVRRSGDGAALDGVGVAEQEVATYAAGAYTRTDASGHFRLIVRKNWGHALEVYDPHTGAHVYIQNVYAGSDSTFDLYLDEPTP